MTTHLRLIEKRPVKLELVESGAPPIFGVQEYGAMRTAVDGIGELADDVTVELPALIDRIKQIGEAA